MLVSLIIKEETVNNMTMIGHVKKNKYWLLALLIPLALFIIGRIRYHPALYYIGDILFIIIMISFSVVDYRSKKQKKV